MHITIVYPGVIPVVKYGGTGRDIWYEGRELAKMGHRVTYLTGSGSVCDFARVLVYRPNQPVNQQIPEDTDLVHFHFTPKEPISKPMIVTIHGNSREGDTFHINTVFVSRNHALRHGSDAFVYNGMDWDDYGPADLAARRIHFHFLGNAAWNVKNLRGAIDVVSAAKERMLVLGGRRLNFRMGFRWTPNLNVRFLGFVGGEEKFSAMRYSKGLIFPVLWHEPMGLAIIESLYYGAPVFGTPYGSLPEMIPAEVGFLTNSASSMALAIMNAGSYSPKHCHDYAIEHFNAKKMTESYVLLFEKVLNGESLNPIPPHAPIPAFDGLLPWVE